ncbi:MAG TPA: FG-GAP-like repeat-containing protein [Pyrinomonadaceae bacterium]
MINKNVSMRTAACLGLLLALAAVLMWRGGATAAQTEFNPAITNRQIVDSPVFSAFDDWVKQYLSGNFEGETGFIEAGENLARERRESFKQLIESEPKTAIEKAVPAELRNKLPASIAQFLEKRISARGDFNVYAVDETEAAGGRIINHRLKREFVAGEARYKAFVYGRKASMTTKLDISLQGVVLDDLMAVDENSARIIGRAELAERKVDADVFNKYEVIAEVGGNLIYFRDRAGFDKHVQDSIEWEAAIAPSYFDTSPLSPWTEGTKTLLFIRVDFPDRQGDPIDRNNQALTAPLAQSLIDGQVNQFYVGNSYGKTSLQATVTPTVRMPRIQSFYTRDNLIDLVTDARNAARAAGFETNNFSLDMVAFSYTPMFEFSGISPIGNKGALLNGTFTFKVAAHELGHAYGLMHANLWRTTDGTITGAGGNVEYGDDFDMMGRGATQQTHFNASYKRDLDWLTDENVLTVTRGGVYRVFAFDADAPAGISALKIRKDASKDYWIEFRQQLTNFPNVMNGALIRWEYPFNGWRQTQLLDMNPATTSLTDSSLLIGQTFADDASGIKITVLGKGGTTPESLDIKVELNYSIINGAPFDFDGDNRSDIGVFRPADGAWYLNSSTQGYNVVNFGLASDIIVPAKYNADRTTDAAVFREGVWYVNNSLGNPIIVRFGSAGDIPVPADFDGDGFAEMAVFRPSNGYWYIWNRVFERFTAVQFGANGDKPVPADYDGDGKTDVAVFRPSDGTWYLLRSERGFTAAQFGIAEDKPVAADYDGDGKADIAVYRPSSGTWYLSKTTEGFAGVQFGIQTDLPAPADYDGDGKTDLAVYRGGTWYLLRSTAGFAASQFGAATDKPVANAYIN